MDLFKKADETPVTTAEPAEAEPSIVEPAAPAGPLDLPTAAPVIGRVLPAVSRSPRPGHEPRVPDVAADGLVLGDYSLAAASLIGSGHAGNGSSRQDSYAFGLDAHGRVCAVVADGLGSRPLSQLGARLLCEEVVRVVATLDASQPVDLADLIGYASSCAAELAEQCYGVSSRDTACVAVVGIFDGEQHRVARVGDCTAFAFGAEGFTELFTEDGVFVNLVGTALLDGPVGDVELAEWSPGPVVLCTDGLANDIRTSPALRAWLGERWQRPATAFAVADSLRYRRQGSHDDRTALVLWPRPQPDAGGR